jgi:mRNA-degrading endonuclease RelE of RelBE toxin-antitoxin system
MTAMNLISIEIPENVINSLKILSPDRRQQVFDFVEFLSQKQDTIAVEDKIEEVDMKNPRSQ